MIGIDSNILLRIFLAETAAGEENAHQVSLVKKLIDENEEALFINHVVVAETMWVLRQKMKLSRAAIAGAVRQLLSMENVTVQDDAVVAAALDLFVDAPGDFSDHLIGTINRHNGCRTTYTFDKAASKSPNFSELTR